MERWVRVQWKTPAFEISFRDSHIVEVAPTWPEKTFEELVEIGLHRPQLIISSMDHQVVRLLRGQI